MKKVYDSIVDEIRSRYMDGCSVKDLMEAYGLSRSSIYRFVSDLSPKKERVIEEVKHFVPSYKKEITPVVSSTSFTHKGIDFSIDFLNKSYYINNPAFNSELFNGTSDKIDFFIKTLEDTIGVLMFVRDSLKEK